VSLATRAALAACLVLASVGCDEKQDAPQAVRDRSNAVTANGPEATAPTATAPKVAAAPKRKELCTSKPDRPAPKTAPKAVAAPDGQAPALPMPFGVGKWTWVNLWAAWCAPCKEEMPRIAAWQKKLGEKGVSIEVAFVSMDDDERQLHRFLESQPQGGVRASYWLPEGEPRYAFLKEIGVSEKVSLPVQALVAPSGQTACVIEGAVEESDYPALAALVGAKP
jgi:thiol-disulfide isomerase/thioredoxin